MKKLLIAPLVALVALAAAALPPPTVQRAVAAQRSLVDKQPTAQHGNDLGNLLELAGRNDEARDAYDKALALDGKLSSAHYNLGLLLRQAGDAGKALDHFRQVVELVPDDAWGWYQLGAVYEARGAEKSAVHAYARAFGLDPRLSFSDVNPQVIDSKLTTQALLVAEQERPQGAEARRAYEDPHRIAKLLLPVPPPADAKAAAGGASGSATGRPTMGGMGSPTSPPAAPAASPESRVLRPQDLHRGSQAGSVTGPRQPTGRDLAPPPSPGYSELLRQQLELQQQQQQELEQQQQQQEEGAEPPPQPPPTIYVPGVRSSGQISQRLDEMRG